MSFSTTLRATCLISLLFAAAFPALAGGLEKGSAAPNWKTDDIRGHALASDRFKGKVLVVDFWATWCKPCVSEIPGYVELEKKYGGQGLAIVGFSLDTTGEKPVTDFIGAHHLNYPVAFATDDVTAAFGGDIEVIPTTFVFDRSGHLAFKKVGAMKPEDFEAVVKPLLDQK